MKPEKVSEKHRELFHYTSYSGFLGILSSQTLWAKNYQYLNDATEIVHMQEKLFDSIVPRIKRLIKQQRNEIKHHIKEIGGRDALARNQASVVMETFFEETFGTEEKPAMFTPYITSFCSHIEDGNYEEDNGLLSMWRGYGEDGGIALVFDTKELEDCLRRESEEYLFSFGAIGDVVYAGNDADFMDEFGDFIEVFKDKAVDMLTGTNEVSLDEKFIKSFLNSVTRYKHRAFKEEREVRIVSVPWDVRQYDMAEKSEIAGGKLKLPFQQAGAEFIALFDGDTVPRLPVTRVIIGPHQEQGRRLQEIAELLKHRRDIDVRCSKTPYIGKL